MAVWRVKAYEAFGFRRGSYSYAHGIADLFADLHHMTVEAHRAGDEALLERIFEYALWANEQKAENLRSAADIAFFLPLLADEANAGLARKHLPASVLDEKLRLLAEA